MSKTYPEAIKHYPRSMQIIVIAFHNRIEKGKNCLIPFVGQTGGGKSLSTISIMIALHLYRHGKMPEVNYIVDHCVFKAKEFMKGLNNENLKKKDKWNWDEAGIDIGHKSHASKSNKIIGWLVQTFRNLQQTVFFTVPSMSFIDASVRKMFHYYLEAVAIDKNKNICVVKPLIMQYNNRMDKIYYHNFTYTAADGYLEEVEFMGVPLPPPEFVEAYEKKKSQFTTELNLEIQEQLEQLEHSNEKRLTERQENILKLLKDGMTSTTKIAEELGLKQPRVSENFRFMRNKGILIDKYLEKTKNTQIIRKQTST